MSSKKISIISDEERQQFRDAVADVKPLKQTQFHKIQIETTQKPEKINIKRVLIKQRENFSTPKTISTVNEKQPEIAGEDIISFSRSGLQHKRMNQLRQGKMCIEATLDLHEHTSDEAIRSAENFLHRSQNKGFRTVCIIHGKGHYSADNKPILKNLLNSYLRQHPLVLAFHSAKNKQGGTGAIIVLIKSK
jgi:DNA-nicking Smr family endonuclease